MTAHRCVLLCTAVHCCVLLCTAVVLQAWPDNDLLVQYGVWRDTITAVVQVEPPPPESGESLGTFALSVMPPGPERSICFRRDVIFVFDRSGSMTGACAAGASSTSSWWQGWLVGAWRYCVRCICSVDVEPR
jgi:hypothetical protein